MNIFYINECPYAAARDAVDKHVVKMPLESLQLLSTAHRMLDGEPYEGRTPTGRKAKRWKLPDSRDNVVYQAISNVNHPCAIWVRESVGNYNWLVEHLFGQFAEYTHRYGKHHKGYGELSFMLSTPPFNLRKQEMTKHACSMFPEFIISDDPLINYRNYYNKGKRHLFAYKNRTPPEWLEYESNTEHS